MILAALVMLALAVLIIAYVLEPVIRARVDRVEIDAAANTPPVPDFEALLDEFATPEDDVIEETRQPHQSPEPAEHRS